MFKEILKIIPQIASSDLTKMERSLQGRFTRIAKSFGKGISNSLKFGAIAGIATGLIDKFLNPLKETQEALDRTLKRGDDLGTRAKQFNSTPARLAKVQAFAGATGLDVDSLAQLLTKFQVAVAEASADPSKPSAVSNFTNQKDTVEGFFSFIQALQKLDTNAQLLAQQEVFGEKQIGKLSEFLNADFSKLTQQFAQFREQDINRAVEKTGNLSDLNDLLLEQRNLQDIITKSQVINASFVKTIDQSEKARLAQENERFKNFEAQAQLNTSVNKILGIVEQGIGLIGSMLVKVAKLEETLGKISVSNIFKSFFGKSGQ